MTNQRLKDLEDNIAKDEELLKDFEDELRYETYPKLIRKYLKDIERQKESITCYKSELAELLKELAAEASAQIQLQKVENQLGELQQLNDKIDRQSTRLNSSHVKRCRMPSSA